MQFAIPSLINLMWLLEIEALKLDWFHIPVINECEVWGYEKWDQSFLPGTRYVLAVLLSISAVPTPSSFYLWSLSRSLQHGTSSHIFFPSRVPRCHFFTPECLFFSLRVLLVHFFPLHIFIIMFSFYFFNSFIRSTIYLLIYAACLLFLIHHTRELFSLLFNYFIIYFFLSLQRRPYFTFWIHKTSSLPYL